MESKTSSPKRSSLVAYAVSRLSPEVFSHPVWLRFGQREDCESPGLVEDLLRAAQHLYREDPGAACQVLLMCAVYQNAARQQHNALSTTQQVISLAQDAHLDREMIWAMWGACAIALQQGNYEEATRQLIDLQAAFHAADEWVLANLIDVCKQSIVQTDGIGAKNYLPYAHDEAFTETLTFFFHWLQHWGFSPLDSEPDVDTTQFDAIHQAQTYVTSIQSFLSIEHWQVRLQTFMLAIRGELKLQWIGQKTSFTKQQSSHWGAMLTFLKLNFFHHRIDAPNLNTPVLPSGHNANSEHPMPFSKEPESSVTEGNAQFSTAASNIDISIAVHMLGAFNMTIGDMAVKLPSSRSLSLFKYLLLHHKRYVSRELLMEIFWPESEPETARNSLNVAIHNLRRVLRAHTELPVILFEGGAYGLSPGLKIWLDAEEFERSVKAGQSLEAKDQLAASVAEYESAISLYQGEFLEENPYEEWTILDRERLRITYLETLDRLSQIYFEEEHYSACRTACQLILIKDPCREDAHCLLMRCYSRQRQPHLALYQYQVCVEALRGELQVEPAPETTQLYNRIRRREQV